MTPDDSPVGLAQRQLDAYNAHDLAAFLACYDPEVELRDFPSGELRMRGHEAMAARYGPLFARAELHAELVGRVAVGSVVVDQERVRGLVEGQVVHALALYEVREGLIRAVWFVRGEA